ncbi:kinase-like domain-containing protein [Durotheca rogersii]|uniref:kinase-like domain-containing protein n=1 Tax=Durotheca rogersii TaxID=419775 RepID=UPI00221F91E4|nr:kinase-like domain-containing protein [Durotheca rogersii]KAI5866054.1 kinase-like domain-containing protein [Durotheca rogersii]
MPKFWRSQQRDQLKREIDTYTHLPLHPRLIRMLSYNKDGDDTSLTLEYMPNGSLAAYLRNNAATVTAELRARWALQAAQGVAMLHAHSVIHADLKPTNMLLDKGLGLRIADFSGCSLLGKPPYILESGPFYMPADWREHSELPCNVTTDIFALGSCIFQIATGKKPYEGLEDDDIEKKFASWEFPGLEGILFAEVIRKCWFSEFESAEAVLQALSMEVRDILGDSEFPSKALG